MRLTLFTHCMIVIITMAFNVTAAQKSAADREREEKNEKARQVRTQQQLAQASVKEAELAMREVQRKLSARGISRPLVPEVIESAPPEVKAFIAESIAKRDASIQYNMEQLRKQAESLTKLKSASSPQVTQQEQKIAETQDRIVSLYTTNIPQSPFFPDVPLCTGMIGRFKYPFRITQIQGEQDMIGERLWSVERRTIRSISGAYEKGSVYEVVKPEDHTETVWIAKYSTSGLADNQSITLDNVFIVSGAKTYTTVLGASRTVLTLTAINIDEYIKK